MSLIQPIFTDSFTVTIAAPGIFTAHNHGLQENDQVMFQTNGALPTGLTAGTWYWVISDGLTDDAFEVSTTKGGTAVTTTGTQSGTHLLASDRAGGFTINQDDSCQ